MRGGRSPKERKCVLTRDSMLAPTLAQASDLSLYQDANLIRRRLG